MVLSQQLVRHRSRNSNLLSLRDLARLYNLPDLALPLVAQNHTQEPMYPSLNKAPLKTPPPKPNYNKRRRQRTASNVPSPILPA